MLTSLGSVIDPLANSLNLIGRYLAMGIGRRHVQLGVI